jgi:hypothetical protein
LGVQNESVPQVLELLAHEGIKGIGDPRVDSGSPSTHVH